MRHIDLFSGIGGFAITVDQVRSEPSGDRCGKSEGAFGNRDSNAPDTERPGQQEPYHRSNAEYRTKDGTRMDEGYERHSWNENWLEVATELCGVDDGLPAELDGLKFSKSKHRVERLKALGNSLVPQVAIEIMRAIKGG